MHPIACEILPDHRFDMRITRQQRSVTVVHGNCRALTKRKGCEVPFDAGWRSRSCDDPQKFAFRSSHLVSDDGRPAAGEAALHQFDQNRRHRSS